MLSMVDITLWHLDTYFLEMEGFKRDIFCNIVRIKMLEDEKICNKREI